MHEPLPHTQHWEYRLGPLQTLALAGPLSLLWLLFNWLQGERERERERQKEICDKVERKRWAEGPCGSPENSGQSPLLREKIGRVSCDRGWVGH